MARVTAIFLSCLLLLNASDLLASSVEETYQAALAQEKGEGDLAEAIRLYQQVVAAHEQGEGDEGLAARAQLRIGVCQEKLGLAQARQTYEAVRDKYADQPQVETEATQRLKSALQREATIEGPPALSIEQRRSYHQAMIEGRLSLSVPADSALIGEQMRLVQQQMAKTARQLKALQRQLKQQQPQLRTPPNFLRHPDQRYYHYASAPPVVPYAYEEVAAVPSQWKFRLAVDGSHPQHHRSYSTLDFDDSDWATINIGQAYEDQGYAGYDGWAWYRTTLTVAADSLRPVLMACGGLGAKDAFVYVNGHLVGRHYDQWDRPFILDISDHVVRDGENAVALYLYDDLGMGGVYGLINVHQPTDEGATDDFASNRGGHLEMEVRNGWPVFKDHLTSGQPYRRYAGRPPRIPYAYNKVAAVPVQWKFNLYAENYQDRADPVFSRADFDDSDWVDIDIGRAWEDQGYVGYDEGAWYRARLEVNAAQDRPVHLAFGGVDNNAYVYVNGTFVGEHHGWNTPFILDISDAVNYKGQNAVAVWVYDGMEMGGIFGTIEVIQPTVKENLDRYLANRGGSEKPSFWRRFF